MDTVDTHFDILLAPVSTCTYLTSQPHIYQNKETGGGFMVTSLVQFQFDLLIKIPLNSMSDHKNADTLHKGLFTTVNVHMAP